MHQLDRCYDILGGKLPSMLALQGAKIADNAVIDTVDVMDFPYLEIGEKAAIGDGCTIIAHRFKDGHITFSKVPLQ